MALRYENPLQRIAPKTGPQVQNLGGMQPNTAPIANRPVAQPAVRQGTPGPVAAPVPSPIGALPPQVGGYVPPPPTAPTGPLQASLQTAIKPPAPAAPAPPSAAPAQAASAPASGGYTPYGPGGGGTPGLEDQIRQYITGAMGGVTSKAFIDRAKNQLGSAVEGQRAQGVRRINDDAIRRGLFQSGIPAEGVAAAETGARGALSSGIADILSRAEQQDIAGRESAAGVAGNLLGANREEDRYQQQRADDQAARAAAGRRDPTTFTYVDPDTGESYEMDEAWF